MSETVQLTTLPKSNFSLGDTGIEITQTAINVFLAASETEKKEFVRIGVKGGGCSGFMYLLDFIEQSDIDQEEDLLINWGDGLSFVVDVFSKDYLKGTVIDHVTSLRESGFKFINPVAKKTCGCGSSFSA